MSNILIAVYLLIMLGAGWRLFGMAWSRGVKTAAGALLVCPLPMLFLLPALLHPDRPFADILLGLGLVLLLCGTLCLCAGMGVAWMRMRRA
ncbi:hypothetical protein [Sphingobium sp.]|uniref:hypothetical protein n=1 Tax=Sphingobium sp. TaxID=1912891 RepID=UPI003BB64040